MKLFKTRDDTMLYYKDWGTGPAIVLSHGWPLDADAWDPQMLFLAQRGFRVIAHDRRGHGRSSQPWGGHTMDQYADDLAELLHHLEVKDAILVGHSTGGGEVVRYLARHGEKRVAGLVLISAVPPRLLKTEKNPGGIPLSAFDQIRDAVIKDRPQFLSDFSLMFYGYNRPGAKASEGVRRAFWLQGMLASVNGFYDCIRAFSETDQTEDLRKIEVPTLVIQGDDDQVVPIDISGRLSVKLVKNGTLKVFPGAPHGLCTTHADAINQELIGFVQQKRKAA
ncbi:MAG TPA: alpha/beta hydrolase [Terriglobales bacterium]|nr:alpha/beta hydrolase [Terriglobales bacterium]